LGYQLIRAKKFGEAIRVLQLNVEVYPRSGNIYDSLAEAYMDDGNKSLAIANYEKSLQFNPKNFGAVLRCFRNSKPLICARGIPHSLDSMSHKEERI